MAVVAAVVGGALAVGGAVAGSITAGKAAREAGRRASSARARQDYILDNRQDIINPYDQMSSVTDLASDLTNTLSNPFGKLGVATKAAEMQAEEADIALANTLDTLLATGAGAGGATALAQAALQSKKGVSASIETQEAANEKMKAEGEQAAQQAKYNEAVRMQNTEMQDAMRLQNANAQGRAYEFEMEEQRDENELSRLAGREQQAAANRASAQAGKAAAFGGLASAGGSILGAAISDRRLKKNIKLIGMSPSGLNIYAFEYINKLFGKGVWQGVMADEMPKKAIIRNFIGNFDGVNYSSIDVEFKKIN